MDNRRTPVEGDFALSVQRVVLHARIVESGCLTVP